jgi:hypothetical protein
MTFFRPIGQHHATSAADWPQHRSGQRAPPRTEATMTGIGWLDAAAVICFAAVTVRALVRIGRRPGLDHFLDDAFHAVMGVAMTAMFWPGIGRSTGVWLAVIGLVVVWPLVVLTLASRGPEGLQGRVSLAHTGYWLGCALLMVIAVGAGHEPSSMATMPGAHPAQAGIGASGLALALQAAAGWPVWPLVGIGFLVYAGLLCLARRPLTDRACAAVMAAGMALMAFSI